MARRQDVPRRPSVRDPLAVQSRRPTKLQRRALRVLGDAHARLVGCPSWNRDEHPLTLMEVESLAEDPYYDLPDWLGAVLRAARAGVLSNKELLESSSSARVARLWIREWQSQGQRDLLARAKIGLERRVKPPFSLREVELSNAIWEKMEDTKYPTIEAVRRALIEEGAITKMTKQSFHRLLARLELRTTK
jgi:hypothetical protein